MNGLSKEKSHPCAIRHELRGDLKPLWGCVHCQLGDPGNAGISVDLNTGIGLVLPQVNEEQAEALHLPWCVFPLEPYAPLELASSLSGLKTWL